VSITATAKIKQARNLAERYRDKWADNHADNVANIEDYDEDERFRYFETCLKAHRLPWEKTK